MSTCRHVAGTDGWPVRLFVGVPPATLLRSLFANLYSIVRLHGEGLEASTVSSPVLGILPEGEELEKARKTRYYLAHTRQH